MITFAKRMRELRKSKHITLNDLAIDLKTTQATLSRYENGERIPNIDFLFQLATYFNVSTDYLLDLNYEDSSVSSNNNIKQDERMEKALELLGKFEQLPYDKQRAIEILIGMSEQAATKLPEAK